jgi:hypothetical protein
VFLVRSPVAYHSAGSRSGTATLKFYEGRDNLSTPTPIRKGARYGDELTFHDLLLSHGTQVGDEGGSCVVVDVS